MRKAVVIGSPLGKVLIIAGVRIGVFEEADSLANAINEGLAKSAPLVQSEAPRFREIAHELLNEFCACYGECDIGTQTAIDERARLTKFLRERFSLPTRVDSDVHHVTMDWSHKLPLQQQSVLLLALRGPDGFRKHHPCKDIVRAYRGCVIKAAYWGRPIGKNDLKIDSFMSPTAFNGVGWDEAVKGYMDSTDELPHHYHLHMMHGAQILGAHHPDPDVRRRWGKFYCQCCDELHVNVETNAEMDRRLSDWDRKHWGE